MWMPCLQVRSPGLLLRLFCLCFVVLFFLFVWYCLFLRALILTWSLCLILLFCTHLFTERVPLNTTIVNEKSTFLFRGWSETSYWHDVLPKLPKDSCRILNPKISSLLLRRLWRNLGFCFKYPYKYKNNVCSMLPKEETNSWTTGSEKKF